MPVGAQERFGGGNKKSSVIWIESNIVLKSWS